MNLNLVSILCSQEVVTAILKGDCLINKKQAEVLGNYFHVSPNLFLE
jgi:hypothetical protein